MKKLTLLLSIASLALFVACKKKDSGGVSDPGVNLTGQACQLGTPPQNGYICLNGIWYPSNGGVTGQACSYNQVVPAGYSCMNGVLVPTGVGYAGSGNLLNNVQMQSSYFQGMLSVSGSATGSAADFSDPSLINRYSGQITIQGSVNVINQSLCGAPPGAYSMQGTGMVNYGVMGNTMLTFTGPASMQIMVYSGQFRATTGMGLSRDTGSSMVITFGQLTVNGMPCGSITTY